MLWYFVYWAKVILPIDHVGMWYMSKVVFCTLACFAVLVKTKTSPRSGMFTTSQYRSVLMFHIVHSHQEGDMDSFLEWTRQGTM